MPLESLLELVETLKQRVKQHGDDLKASEALTRYALIDPLLRELGWDTSDPAVVVPEYRSGSGSADYALLCDGSPAMMVEAKKLGTHLQDSVILQVLNYCQMEGTKHFAITDGARWGIYDTHKPVPMNEKQVAAFDLMSQSPAEFCLNALSLWRPSAQAGYVAGDHSLIINEPVKPQLSATNDSRVMRDIAPPPDRVTPLPGDWRPLTAIDHKGPMPVEILFPDGHQPSLERWNGMLIETVNWLIHKGMLLRSHCPIRSSPNRGHRYVVHTEPTHMNGTKFKNEKLTRDGFYVEMGYSPRGCVRCVLAIINHIGQDPAQFKVRFD